MNIYDLERFSEDAFRVKRAYIDITGDFISGVLLGQIVFWNMPDKEGKTKLRVNKDGRQWLAKGRTDWWEEIRITPKQFDRAIKILKSLSLVETKLYKFNNAPTLHISLNESELYQRVNSILTKGENGFYPKGEIDFPERGITKDFTQRVNSITENTEITTENTNIPFAEIVGYLNEKANKSFKHSTSKTRELIRARWKENFTLEDFKKVIDIKCAEWLHKADMNKYLRPETLFGSKFEGYLNQNQTASNDSRNSVFDDLYRYAAEKDGVQ